PPLPGTTGPGTGGPGTGGPGTGGPGGTRSGGSVAPLAPGDALVYLDVPRPGGGDDVGRDLRAGWLAVPPGDRGGPVPQELLVQVSLRSAWRPLGSRPEAR